jgi:hypothetical protein
MAFRAQIKRDGQHTTVTLTGSIDENAPIEAVLTEAIAADTHLNLSQVQRINSIGLSKWIAVFTPLSERHRITIEAVPYCLAVQANQVLDVFGRARVMSALAPYYCPTCKATRDVLVDADAVIETKGEPPLRKCDTCGNALDFDETDVYFGFLSRSK